jgi:hypothetical protein
MGRAGRRRAEEFFDVRRMVAGYENLYLEHAPRRGRKGARLRKLDAVSAAADLAKAVE